jgi:hypothetical protein
VLKSWRNVGSKPPDVASKRGQIYITAMLVAVALLRVSTAGYSLWYDELASLEFAGQPLARLWSAWMVRETNPPLFYSLLSGSIRLFGHSDVALRLLPITIGMVGIWAAYLLGRAIGDLRSGLLSAALLSLSAQHTDLSHQVRAYGLAHTAVLLACMGMVLYLQRRSSAGLILYAGAMLVALYAHTTLALFAATSGATMLWLLRDDRQALMRWAGTNIVLLALWSWWALISFRQMMMPVSNIAWIGRPSFYNALCMTEVVYLPLYLYAQGTISAVLLAGLFGGVGVWAARTRKPELALLATLAFATPLILFAISQRVPIFLPRTLSWASGPELVLLAFVVTRIPVPTISKAVAGILLCSSAIGLAAWMPIREREQWRQSVVTLERRRAALVFVGDDAVALAIDKYRTVSRADLSPIVVQSAQRERWSSGLYTGPHISPQVARGLIRDRGCALVVEWGAFHPPIVEGMSVKTISLTGNSAPKVTMVILARASPKVDIGGIKPMSPPPTDRPPRQPRSRLSSACR